MSAEKVAVPFPWEALDCMGRAAVKNLGPALRRVERAVRLGKLKAAIESILRAEATLVLHRVRAEETPSSLPATRVELELVDGSGLFVVGLDPELASLAIGHVLGRPLQLELPRAPLGASLVGALSAIVLEVVRRASERVAVRVAMPGLQRHSRNAVAVQASIVLAGRAYEAGAWLDWTPEPTQAQEEPHRLQAWTQLPVSLPLVGGCSLAGRAEIASLRPGDAWSCGTGWTLDGRGLGSAVLAAPGDDFGVRVQCVEGGRIVLGGDRVVLPMDAEEPHAISEANETMAQVLLDTPLVVRVEVGAVSMTLGEWSRLVPGDVIETGKRIADPVVLRIAGREVGRGELVNIEGELGVRIRELLKGDP